MFKGSYERVLPEVGAAVPEQHSQAGKWFASNHQLGVGDLVFIYQPSHELQQLKRTQAGQIDIQCVPTNCNTEREENLK